MKKHLASKSRDSIQLADWSNYFCSDQFHSESPGDTTKITQSVIEKRGDRPKIFLLNPFA